MKEKLQEISQYAIDGLKEFYNHPIKYSSKALKDLVKDYWEVPVVATAGFALTPGGDDLLNNIFEGYKSLDLTQKFFLATSSGLAGLIGGSIRDSGGFNNYLNELIQFISGHRDKSGHRDSSGRNFYAGLTAFLIGFDLGARDPRLEVELGMKLIEALSFAGFVILEYGRLKPNLGPQNNKPLEESLKNNSLLTP